MKFEQILGALKKGHAHTRRLYPGGEYIKLVGPVSFHGVRLQRCFLRYGEGDTAWLWEPSQADLLAEDWHEVAVPSVSAPPPPPPPDKPTEPITVPPPNKPRKD